MKCGGMEGGMVWGGGCLCFVYVCVVRGSGSRWGWLDRSIDRPTDRSLGCLVRRQAECMHDLDLDSLFPDSPHTCVHILGGGGEEGLARLGQDEDDDEEPGEDGHGGAARGVHLLWGAADVINPCGVRQPDPQAKPSQAKDGAGRARRKHDDRHIRIGPLPDTSNRDRPCPRHAAS